MKTDLDFEEKKQELIRFLDSKDTAVMALATSLNDRVLVRNVLVACSGLNIYFFTWGHSRKCMQIEGNPRVALCKDAVQIEGTNVALPEKVLHQRLDLTRAEGTLFGSEADQPQSDPAPVGQQRSEKRCVGFEQRFAELSCGELGLFTVGRRVGAG